MSMPLFLASAPVLIWADDRPPFPEFVDAAQELGVTFVHDSGFDGKRYRVVETVTGGLALLDFDSDGWLDLYFTNGRKIEPGAQPPRNALFRGQGDGTFKEVGAAAKVDDPELSLGCAVADIDGDGDPDLYVTNWGPNRLYRNNGDGTFTDIAAAAGVALTSMDSGCVFFDMDGDGDLDLYVASYVIDEQREYPPCYVRGIPGYWPPRNYPAAPHHLLENQGNGRFAEVSALSGIRNVDPGRGLGTVSADLNGDGHPDLYVANDTTANYLFLGDGKGKFTETGLVSGTAYGEEGAEMGSMGIAAQDYDGDGRLDLCVTNYQNQLNNLFRATGRDFFEDNARLAGIAEGNLPEVAWGVGFVDLDNDGWRDLFIANGHLNPGAHEIDQRTSYPQRKRAFRNLGNGRFEEVSRSCGAAVETPRVSRGIAFGDLDNDGDLDAVVLNSGGKAEVLRNEGGKDNGWCFIRLIGAGLNRDAIGALVAVTAGGRTQWGVRHSAESYLSANDPRLHFGLGQARKIDQIEVRWPDGKREAWKDLPARRLITLTEGKRDFEASELPARKTAAGN
ncbi:MAG: CRTAC1 family protein [Planctomycetes bacterium]|nr:CRTAC1 family protein [Planctomycetota bacterium]